MKSTHWKLIIGLIFLVPAFAGCRGIQSYGRDRGADFADLFAVEAGYGLGIHVDAQGTDFIHPGLGYSQVQKAALHGRDSYWTKDREIGLPGSTLLLIPGIRDGHWHRLGHWHVSSLELRAGQDSWLHRFDTSLGITLGFLQFRLGFSVGQFVDFLGGIAGLDLAGDDRGLELEENSGDQREWFNGDAHVHMSPPDTKRHVHRNLAETRQLAYSEGGQWLMVTPHLWPSSYRQELTTHPLMKTDGQGEDGLPTLLPGWEYSRNLRPGHGLMVFRNLRDFRLLPGWNGDQMAEYWLTKLPEEDLFFAQAHPFSTPLNIPFVGISKADLSWSKRQLRFRKGELGKEEQWTTRTVAGTRYWEYRKVSKTKIEISLGSVDSAILKLMSRFKKTAGTGFTLWSKKIDAKQKELDLAMKGLADELGLKGNQRKTLGAVGSLLSNQLIKERAGKTSGKDIVIRGALGDVELRMTLGAKSAKAIIEIRIPENYGRLLSRAAFERMDDRFDGLEVYNHTVHLAELGLGVPEQDRHITKAFAKLDRTVARRRRPLTPLGGADNHRELMPQTTWLLSASKSPEDLFEALKAGRSVVGSDEARDFIARCDGEGAWQSIGSRLTGKESITLRWRGKARFIVDGEEQGTAQGGITVKLTKDFHFFRIIQGLSHSGYIAVRRIP